MPKITLEVNVSQEDLDKYGEGGIKNLLFDILERYGNEEHYDLNLIEEE